MGIGNYSLEKLYNFIKVKSAQVVLNFTHPPDKNANSVIMKAGTVGTGGHASDSTSVKAGYVYYYSGSEWNAADWDSGPDAGAGYLLGIALGAGLGGRAEFGAAVGPPTKVGMLLRGVTYTSVYGAGGATSGQPLFGSAGGGDPGRIANVDTAGYTQVVGWALKANTDVSGDTLILFDPQYPMSGTL